MIWQAFHIMGVLNVTPDSFSDGNRAFTLSNAIQHAQTMIQDGATIIDIGGESSRPGAVPISVEEELRRVIPVLKQLRQQSTIPISVDTTKPEVMRAAIDAGADLINDINAFRAAGALEAVKQSSVGLCLMHMQGSPQSMQNNPHYSNVVQEVGDFLEQRINAFMEIGIDAKRLIIDPGFGFGKTVQHNLQLIRELDSLAERFDAPILIGVSRKSTIGTVLDATVTERLPGSLALTVMALERGAKIIRTHDVKETRQTARMTLTTLGCPHTL